MEALGIAEFLEEDVDQTTPGVQYVRVVAWIVEVFGETYLILLEEFKACGVNYRHEQ